MEPSVGLIGLGLLGSAMASRLSAAGFRVIGLDPKWSEGLAIDRAASPSEVFERSDRVLLSLPTSAIAQEVLAQAEPALRSNHLVIDTTTGAPDEMVAMARGLRARDADYLEANVAGSSAGMREGVATLFVGGSASSCARAQDILDSLTNRGVHLGEVGAASRFKLVHNLILGLNRAALAEGLSFATAMGFDREVALEALRGTAADSEAMGAKGLRMATRSYVPLQARLSQHLKDVGLMLGQAQGCGASVPLTETHRALLEVAQSRGFGAADNSAIIEAYLD